MQCAGHPGVIERRSLPATWLRDPGADDDRHTLHEVDLRVEGPYHASEVRRALIDAVLTSPWVRREAALDAGPGRPRRDRWYVRAALLDPAFAPRYDGELLERVQSILETSPSGRASRPDRRAGPRGITACAGLPA